MRGERRVDPGSLRVDGTDERGNLVQAKNRCKGRPAVAPSDARGDDGDRGEAERPAQHRVPDVGPAEAVTVEVNHPARQEALDRGQPLALVAEREVPVHEQRAGRGRHQDERDRRHSDEDKTHGVGWEAIDSCLDAALDELPRQIVRRVEHKADDRRRREEVGETRDPCDRESPRRRAIERHILCGSRVRPRVRGEQRLRRASAWSREIAGRRLASSPPAAASMSTRTSPRTVEERLGHVNAANAFEQDRANGPAEHPGVQLETSPGDAIAKAPPRKECERQTYEHGNEQHR